MLFFILHTVDVEDVSVQRLKLIVFWVEGPGIYCIFFFLSFIFFVNGVLATVNPTEQNQGFSIFLCEACSGLKAVLHDYSWSCEV